MLPLPQALPATRRAIKQAGGIRDSQRRLWRAPARAIKQLGLAERMVEQAWNH